MSYHRTGADACERHAPLFARRGDRALRFLTGVYRPVIRTLALGDREGLPAGAFLSPQL
jgi:hypothetical protein